jgi:hypothetical protein
MASGLLEAGQSREPFSGHSAMRADQCWGLPGMRKDEADRLVALCEDGDFHA